MSTESHQHSAHTFELRSTLVFSLLIFLISIRLDGRGSPDLTVREQLGLLPFTLIFIALVSWNSSVFLKSIFSSLNNRLSANLSKIPFFPAVFTIAALEQALAIALLVVQAFYFKRLGYVLNKPGLLVVALSSALAFAVLARASAERRPALLLLASAFASVVVRAYSIYFFPLTPLRSDMLPLILAADHNLLAGHFPYVVYPLISGSVVLTYLPATWLVYLPAAASHTDPRWVSTVLGLAALAVTYFSVPRRLRLYAASLLSLFLLFPYAQFHHEIYISLQWLLAALIFAALQRQRWILAGIAFGCGVGASQLFWITLPFFALYLVHRIGLKQTLLVVLALLASAAIWIAPFLIASPDRFIFGIFTHWSIGNPLSVRAFNFTFWEWTALRFFGDASVKMLQRLQIVCLAILFFAAVRRKIRSEADLWGWATAAITLFALTNFLVWSYFFVTAFFMMILSLLSASAQQANSTELQNDSRHNPYSKKNSWA
ncbi:hypothetical protein [Tunturiibacter lichenicola]|uniref:hypothetical protein n=1 Tax=Tunturiibacter lichenicola TaxID=2051959 RepID=UPI0021B25E2B|nr:hypothetical protein [Edaphobacter lichenicola]